MRLLLLAFACEPNKGSEPGVGWNWAVNFTLYSKVTVLTRANNRYSIEQELKKNPNENLEFIYFDIPFFNQIKKKIPFGTQLYSLLWEYFCIIKIKDLKVDLTQRISLVTVASLFQYEKLSNPYICGFFAGGERTPSEIYMNYSRFNRILETIRINYNLFFLKLKRNKNNYRYSLTNISVTEQTKEIFTSVLESKNCITYPAIGIQKSQICANNPIRNSFNLIYAGRLLYWKNIDIAIYAYSELKIKDIGKFTIIGNGKESKNLKKLVRNKGLSENIIFREFIPQHEYFEELGENSLFIFPSSHDSGGFVILEAIAKNVPVLFLDTGGPREIFREIESYPLRVNPNKTYNEIINDFKEKITWAYYNYDKLMSDFQRIRTNIINKFLWENKVKQLFEFHRVLLRENSPSS